MSELDPMVTIGRYAFWRDGCMSLANNICVILRHAGEPITAANVTRFVQTLALNRGQLGNSDWQHGYANTCLANAFIRGDADNHPEVKSTISYFLNYFVELTPCAQYMLIEAFVGILGVIGDQLDCPKGG